MKTEAKPGGGRRALLAAGTLEFHHRMTAISMLCDMPDGLPASDRIKFGGALPADAVVAAIAEREPA